MIAFWIVKTIRKTIMSSLSQDEINKLTSTQSTRASNEAVITYKGKFIGDLTGISSYAKALLKPFRFSIIGDDASGYADITGDAPANLSLVVSHAVKADSADYTAKAGVASLAFNADLANLATFAIESGESSHAGKADLATEANHTPQADHADKATLADRAEDLTWDMIQIVKEYPIAPTRRVLYIKVNSEFNDPRNWEIVGFKYIQENGLVNETDLTLYRIRFTNRALTEDFLEHRKIWATPSPERTLSNIKGEIEEINVAENDTAIEQLNKREAKFFKQEDLL